MPDSQIKVTLIDNMGSDLSVVNAARVSFGKASEWEWETKEVRMGDGEWVPMKGNPHLSDRDTRLIHYLAKHEHISPFGHAFASFHVKAPVFVARQLVKHKFLRWNEISRRYVDDEPEFYVPDVWRGRSKDKKQGSEGVVDLDQHYPPHQYFVDANEYYLDLLAEGVAPEQARMVLPQSTVTEWYWSGSLDAFASMCKLRLKDDTQYESRLVAQQIDNVMSDLFPVSWKALVHG